MRPPRRVCAAEAQGIRSGRGARAQLRLQSARCTGLPRPRRRSNTRIPRCVERSDLGLGLVHGTRPLAIPDRQLASVDRKRPASLEFAERLATRHRVKQLQTIDLQGEIPRRRRAKQTALGVPQASLHGRSRVYRRRGHRAPFQKKADQIQRQCSPANNAVEAVCRAYPVVR